MSLKHQLIDYLRIKPRTLEEIYNKFPQVKQTTIRGRINENVGVIFFRMAKGTYLSCTQKQQLIYADPPWPFNNTNSNGAAKNHYSTLTLDEMKEMQIKELSDKNAVLFMWAPNSLLPDAIELMQAWGFTYKTVGLYWNKTSKKGSEKMGLGNCTRQCMEQCLYGVRGRGLARRSKSVSQRIDAPVEKHSRKPLEAYNRIEELFGKDIERMELFARCEMPGWNVMGDQVQLSLKPWQVSS